MKIKVTGIISPDTGMKQETLKGIIIEGKPKLTAVYELVEYNAQTDQQRKLFNPLARLYYNSGCYSYKASNWMELRDQIKLYLGAGYDWYKYADKKYRVKKVYKVEDIPDYVLKDFLQGNRERIDEHLKSMADYTRKEMISVCDSLIREMLQSEVMHTSQAKKFNEILIEIKFKE